MADISFGSGDIELNLSDLVLTSDKDVTEGIRQDLIATLSTFAGEYFLNPDVGVPWIDEIFQAKPLSVEAASAVIGRAVLSVVGVQNINRLNFDFTTGDRKLTIDLVCQTDQGALISDNIQIGI